MGKKIQLIFLIICTFVVITSNHPIPIAELLPNILLEKWKLKHKYHLILNRPTTPLPPPPKPLGGKERYDQICRIQKGIPACFT